MPSSSQVKEEGQKYEEMKQYYNKNYFDINKWDEFDVDQMEYFQAMLAAEIEKRKLPVYIKNATKDLADINLAISQIDFEELQRKNAKKDAKAQKRAREEVAKRVGSSSGGPSSSSLRKHQRRR